MSFRKGTKKTERKSSRREDSKRLTGLFVGGFGHGRRFVSTEAHTQMGWRERKRESKKEKVRFKLKEKRKRKTERETCE